MAGTGNKTAAALFASSAVVGILFVLVMTIEPNTNWLSGLMIFSGLVLCVADIITIRKPFKPDTPSKETLP